MAKRFIRLKEFSESRSLIPSNAYRRNLHSDVGDGPFQIEIDSNHFIVSPHSDLGASKHLVFLGDSFCEQSFIRYGSRFTDIIQYRYRNKCRVLNSGYSGMNSLQALSVFYAKVIPLAINRRTAIVYFIPSNDIDSLSTEDCFWNLSDRRYSPIVPAREAVSRSSTRATKLTLHDWLNKRAIHGINLIEQLAFSCMQYEIPLVLVTMPYVGVGYESHPWFINKYKGDLRRYKYLTRVRHAYNSAICDRLNYWPSSLVIDLESAIVRKGHLFYDELHLNESGAQYISDILIETSVGKLAESDSLYDHFSSFSKGFLEQSRRAPSLHFKP